MNNLPESLERYPTRAGRAALATRLGLPNISSMQDWEWVVADAARFHDWVRVYREEPLTDDERFSLMEMLIQCVDDIATKRMPGIKVDDLSEWQVIASLLRERPRLHAASVAYWALLDHDDDPDHLFAVSAAMRRVWETVRPRLDP